jgi:hypothetical protein
MIKNQDIKVLGNNHLEPDHLDAFKAIMMLEQMLLEQMLLEQMLLEQMLLGQMLLKQMLLEQKAIWITDDI